MNKLFVRIWLANWLVFVLVIFSSIFVFQQWRIREVRLHINHPPVPTQQLMENFQQAIKDGEKPEEWARRLTREKQVFFMAGPNVEALPGIPPPSQRPPPLRRHFNFFSPIFLAGLAFLASGLAAIILARYITLPIKQLHLASDKVASGDFQTNVAASVGHRKDEIADLARHFDLMAQALDTANKNQRDLLRDVSHELRSPLTRLLLISDLLTTSDGEELARLRQRLKKELGDLDTLVDEVMVLARFEFESGSLDLAKNNLIAVLEPMIDDAKFEANAVNKTVTFLHGEDDYAVALSPQHICRAVENIVRNAIRHTRDNTEVCVEVNRDAEHIILTVSDQGEGVEESELNKIFSPFYRSASARAKFRGAGIGLALAERIVKSHNGEISARNLAESGLQIRITLPVMA